MKKMFIILILLGFFSFPVLSQNAIATKITYIDSAYIKIIANNVIDTITFQTRFYSFFPHNANDEKKIVVSKPGVYYLAFRITKPEMIHFDIEGNIKPTIIQGDTLIVKEGFKLDENLNSGIYFQSLIIPKDTLVINVGFKTNEQKEPFIYYTANGNIHEYYQSKKQKIGYYSFLDHDYQGISRFFKNEISRSEYNEAIGIIDYSVEQNNLFLDQNKKNLPNWFYDLEKADIIYGAARISTELFNKLTILDQKRNSVISVEMNNPKAIFSAIYYSFLNEYFFREFSLSENFNKGLKNFKLSFLVFQSNMADSILSGEIKDYFITGVLADQYSNVRKAEDVKNVDSFIVMNYPQLSDDKIQYINSIKKRSLKFIKLELLNGDNAPGFYLRDLNGTQYQLTNFTDKFVYLHFWSTLNEESMKDISALNKLHSKISDKPIEIVHICMDDNTDNWMQIIKNENLKGVNLICKGSWGKTLKSSYFIEELPHYVLIDKKGNIVQNKCNGPANIYSKFIELMGN